MQILSRSGSCACKNKESICEVRVLLLLEIETLFRSIFVVTTCHLGIHLRILLQRCKHDKLWIKSSLLDGVANTIPFRKSLWLLIYRESSRIPFFICISWLLIQFFWIWISLESFSSEQSWPRAEPSLFRRLAPSSIQSMPASYRSPVNLVVLSKYFWACFNFFDWLLVFTFDFKSVGFYVQAKWKTVCPLLPFMAPLTTRVFPLFSCVFPCSYLAD